eukprot:1148196-Pelagomonas_calceolata.AAC.3
MEAGSSFRGCVCDPLGLGQVYPLDPRDSTRLGAQGCPADCTLACIGALVHWCIGACMAAWHREGARVQTCFAWFTSAAEQLKYASAVQLTCAAWAACFACVHAPALVFSSPACLGHQDRMLSSSV